MLRHPKEGEGFGVLTTILSDAIQPDRSGRDRLLRLVPFAHGVPPEGLGEFRVAFTLADRAFHQIDSPSQTANPASPPRRIIWPRPGTAH